MEHILLRDCSLIQPIYTTEANIQLTIKKAGDVRESPAFTWCADRLIWPLSRVSQPNRNNGGSSDLDRCCTSKQHSTLQQKQAISFCTLTTDADCSISECVQNINCFTDALLFISYLENKTKQNFRGGKNTTHGGEEWVNSNWKTSRKIKLNLTLHVFYATSDY